MKREDIIEKITALKRKSEDGGCTEAEATLFATKVTELMEKHTISMHELGEKPDHIRVDRNIKYMGPWRRILLNECATGCFCVLTLGGGERVSMFGRPLNIEMAFDMFHFIEGQCVLIARDLFDGRKAQRRAEGGLAMGIARKIHESKLSTQEAKLPVLQEREDVMEFTKEAIPSLEEVSVKEPKQTREALIGALNSDRIKLREAVT